MNILVEKDKIPVVVMPRPFSLENTFFQIPEGGTLEEILFRVQPNPILRKYTHIFLDDIYVEREEWNRIIPSLGQIVSFRVVPAHNDGGGKDVMRVLMTLSVVAASVAAPYIAGGVFLTAGGGLSWAGIGLSVGISFIGGLAINALVPISPPKLYSGSSEKESQALSVHGGSNSMRLYDVIPEVLGKHLIYPPYGAMPYTEIVGDDQYLRLLFVIKGVYNFTNLKIGDTPIDNYTDVQYEIRQGYDNDNPTTLYSNSVFEESLALTLTQAGGYQQRTTIADTDEISVDISFLQGLVSFSSNGEKQNVSVDFNVEYRLVGNLSWIVATTLYITAKKASLVRKGYRWTVTKGQYEVRIVRNTNDSNSSTIYDVATWTILRSIRNVDNVTLKGVAKVAMRIKATGQLNGIISNFNCVVESIVPDWNGSAWVTRGTSNPASLYRYILQGSINPKAMSDSKIDLPTLQSWADTCTSLGYKFNGVLDHKITLLELLNSIAVTGKANYGMREDKYSVIQDKPQSVICGYFTPRNSWGFEAEKTFSDPPHAFRISFINEDAQYKQDERIVYADGYNKQNASKFEKLDFWGITNVDIVWKFGRFFMAAASLRPEIYRFNIDIEHFVCTRGDLVRVSHDVILVGLGSGRIKSLSLDGSNNVLGITTDGYFIMESGKTYGAQIRKADGTGIIRTINAYVGETNTFTFTISVPPSQSPAVGDLIMFGESGKISADMIVAKIEVMVDLSARLTVVDASPAIFDADTGTIPPFDPQITFPFDFTTNKPNPPTISVVKSDGTVLSYSKNGFSQTQIVVSVKLVSSNVAIDLIEVQYRTKDDVSYGEWKPVFVKAQISEVAITGTDVNQFYEIRARAISEYGVESNWSSTLTHTVIGDNTPPNNISNFSFALRITDIYFSWAASPRVEYYEIRKGNDWATAIFIGKTKATNYVLNAQSSGNYTFLIKGISYSSVESTTPSNATLTIQLPTTPSLTANVIGDSVKITWADTKTTFAIAYYVVNNQPVSQSLQYIEQILWTGNKTFEVYAVDIAGNQSSVGSVVVNITTVAAPTQITTEGKTFAIKFTISYTNFTGFEAIEIWASDSNDRSLAKKVGESTDGIFVHNGLPLVDAGRYYWVRIRDIYGNLSAWYPSSSTAGIFAQSSQSPTDYLSLLSASIGTSQLNADLGSKVRWLDNTDYIYKDVYEDGIYGGIDIHLGAIQVLQQSQIIDITDLKTARSDHLSRILSLEGDIAGIITTPYSTTANYIFGQYVSYNNKIYRCILGYNQPPTILPTDTTHWEETSAISTLVANLDTRVSTLENSITQKVSSVTFNALDNRVTSAESTIVQHSSDISLRVTSASFDAFSLTIYPNFDANHNYILKNYFKHNGVIYQVIQTTNLPYPTPPNATYYRVASNLVSEVETNINDIVVNNSGISLISQAIVGPITYEIGNVYESGVYVETVGDVVNVDTRITKSQVDVDGANASISIQATKINTLTNRVSTAEINIDANTTAIALKASQSALNTLTNRVSVAEIIIDGHTASLTLKASQAALNTLTNRVSTAEININANTTAIALKASQSALDTLTNRVSVAETDITAGKAGTWSSISSRVGIADYNTDQKVSGVLRIATAETNISAIQTKDGQYEAQSTVKLNVNNHVAGVGLLLAGNTSEFIIRADKFAMVSTNEASPGLPKYPFIMGNIGGVFTVGVDGNLVVDGSILARHIGANEIIANVANIKNAIIKTAHIDNLQLTTPKIADNAISDVVRSFAYSEVSIQGGVIVNQAGINITTGIVKVDLTFAIQAAFPGDYIQISLQRDPVDGNNLLRPDSPTSYGYFIGNLRDSSGYYHTLSILDTPPNGAHLYTLYLKSGNTTSINLRSLLLTQLKK